MIHTFVSKRFGDVTYDDNACIVRQNGNVRERGNIMYTYILYDKLDNLNKVLCRIRFDTENGVSYLDSLDYVEDSTSIFNYDSFSKAATFIKNNKRPKGHQIYVGGVRFDAYTEDYYKQAYSVAERKKNNVKVILDGVVFL